MPKIAIILPPREHFRLEDSGAIALTVHAFLQESRFINEIIVFGGYADHFQDVKYQFIKAKFNGLLGRSLDYTLACISQIKKDQQLQVIEVHNRIQLALKIKRALPQRRVTLHFHNDPFVMAGSKTVAEREKLLNALDAVYCVSHYVLDRLLEGVSSHLATRARVIYNAISTQKYNSDIALRQPRIVFAGRMIPEKGVLELAHALTQILPIYPEWKAIFLGAKGFGHQAGRSKYEQSVYSVLAPIAHQIEFRGHVTHDEVMNVYSQSAIAITPSIGAEAFGRTTLEAMESGCAVITSTRGGLKEVAGDAAIIVNAMNAQEISAAISLLINDGLLRHTCAVRCQQYARSTFSLTEQVERLDLTRTVLLVESN
jgi:UDP-glucose:(glucosyl)LPS alpha-1,2-glucosyltransferase